MDGNVYLDNNLFDGFDKCVYIYGYCNVQGIDFCFSDGKVFIVEYGLWYSDEIIVFVNGGNVGWDF